MNHTDYPLRKARIHKEVEELMLPYFNNSSYDFCRWLMRYNENLKGKPFDLYEQDRDLEVLAYAKATIEHEKFCNNIGM